MSEKKLRLIHTVCGCVISAALIVAAICLILSAHTIYKSGDAPFTPDSIGAEYAKIAVPLWVAIAAVALGIVLELAIPQKKKSLKASKDPFITLRILQKKLPTNITNAKIKRERELRRLARIVCTLLCLASFVPAVLFLSWFDHFTVAHLSDIMLETVALLLIGIAVSGVLMLILSFIESGSAKREIEQTKIALSDSSSSASSSVDTNKKSALPIVRFALVGVSCVLIVIGIFTGDFIDVLQKAIRICIECIGLG